MKERISSAFRPVLLVDFLRILCDGLCNARRCHTAEHEHTCRIGCPDEPGSLTHYNECPRLYNIFFSFWRHATILPPRNYFFLLCSQIVLKSLYLARIGKPDILWSVNKLARSITEWTKACDKRPSRLISYIHHICEYKQYCHLGNIS